MKPLYTIREYGSFIPGKKLDGYDTLPPKTFAQLENFILANRSKETDALELMSLSARKGVGKVITARNYVGIITMNDGTTIEILPKVVSADGTEASAAGSRRLLIDMLKTLRDSPFKNLQTSSVNIEKMNILEVFIRMFLDAVFLIVKRGLQCGYETVEENSACFKGKIDFSRQIKHNYAHQERSFVSYDSFQVNRPENRLLKATLQYLYPRSISVKNRQDIKLLLNSFAEVEASVDWKSDFARYIPDRNTRDYAAALRWSRVFLMGKSFTSFAGSEVALALLFPMETLFESYIAALLKKKLGNAEFSVSVQDRTYHLFDEPEKKFQLRPDIVVKRKSDGAVFILDTKWKILADEKANYGISQADMCQMYAYQKKYGAGHVTLLYPKTGKVSSETGMEYYSEDGALVRVRFVDLLNVRKSMDQLQAELR